MNKKINCIFCNAECIFDMITLSGNCKNNICSKYNVRIKNCSYYYFAFDMKYFNEEYTIYYDLCHNFIGLEILKHIKSVSQGVYNGRLTKTQSLPLTPSNAQNKLSLYLTFQ